MDLQIREVSRDEIRMIHNMEQDCYPDDESATYDMLVYRHREASELLIAGYVQGSLVGFVCATRYHGKELTHESMSMHIPNGESVCIHSVAVSKDHRHKGFASQLLRVFIERTRTDQKDVARILLICKSHLIPLYTRVGFVLNGKSKLIHGKDPWYDMQIDITGT